MSRKSGLGSRRGHRLLHSGAQVLERGAGRHYGGESLFVGGKPVAEDHFVAVTRIRKPAFLAALPSGVQPCSFIR